MLTHLSIRNIVLIEALDIDIASGLTALTGETGAGKSILLDSVLLALGARADRALVRRGAERGRVTASFDIPADHAAFALLREEGLDADGAMILRRQVSADGRSKAWINDQPVSQAMLVKVASDLVEIHGQHDDRGLLSPASHRNLLDSFGGHLDLVAQVKTCHATCIRLETERRERQAALADLQAEEDYLRHSRDELASFHPQDGEETALADERTAMMQGEKLMDVLGDVRDALYRDAGLEGEITGLARRLGRQDAATARLLSPIIDALDRAAVELDEAGNAFQAVEEALSFDPAALEATEARLFELRRLARKHDKHPDALAAYVDELSDQLSKLEGATEDMAALETSIDAANHAFEAAASALSTKRRAAAMALDAAVNKELPPLKLEAATFRTAVVALDRGDWQSGGAEVVEFEIETNPASGFGPLGKIASGGELARFILALKVSLAAQDNVSTLIFDEVDRGIGGATAAAVGERLARLSERAQVLLVTHSPQVAARADHQFQIRKTSTDGATHTSLIPLAPQDRVDEIARMLSGSAVTDAARGAAQDLMAGQGAVAV